MSRPGLSRTDRLLLGIVLVTALLVALVIWLIVPPEKSGGLVKQPSTFFNVGYGTKAAYQVLDRLGYPVARLRRPIGHQTLEPVGILFVLRPRIGLRDFEMAQLEAWVKEGHALVVVPGQSDFDVSKKDGRATEEASGAVRGSDGAVRGSPDPAQGLTEGLQDREETHGQTHRRGQETRAERKQRKGESLHPGSFFRDWFALDVVPGRDEETIHAHSDEDRPESGLEVDTSEPICAGIRELVAGSDYRFRKAPLQGPLAKRPAKTFWSDELGIVGVRVDVGQGTIVALADPYPLTNIGIGEADNGLLLGNMVRELSEQYPGEVAFDEYHLGFGERDWSAVAMAKLMLIGPWRWAVSQAVLVGLLALYGAAVRFGSPQDVVYKPRRQHREFAEAAGRLLNEAGATSLAAATLYRHYRDRLCRLVHLEPEVDDARLARAVRDRSGHEIDDLLQQAQGAVSGRVGRQELFTMTQKLHRVVEALDHGT